MYTLTCQKPHPFSTEEESIEDYSCLGSYHTFLPNYITFPYSPKMEWHSSQGASLLCSHFAWQSNKNSLFFSSRTVLIFLFVTDAQRAKILAVELGKQK